MELSEAGFDTGRWGSRDLLIGLTGVGLAGASLMNWYSARWQAGWPIPAGDVTGTGWTTSWPWTTSVLLGVLSAVLWLYFRARPSMPRRATPVFRAAIVLAVVLFGWQWFTLPESTYRPPDSERDISMSVVQSSAGGSAWSAPTMAVAYARGGARQPGFSSEIGLGGQLAALALLVQLVVMVKPERRPWPDDHQSGAP